MREVGVHLADEVRGALLQGVKQAVDVRAAEAANSRAVHDFDASRMLARELIRDGTGTVGRIIIDDEHANTVVFEHAGGEQRKVLALVIGWNDNQYVHANAPRPARQPKRSMRDRSRESGTVPAGRIRR